MSVVNQSIIVVQDKDTFVKGLAKHMAAQSCGEAGADRLRIEGAVQVLDYIEIIRVPKEDEPEGGMTDKFYEYVELFF